MENIELRSTKLIIENVLFGTTYKMETAEERTSEPDDKSKYIIQPDIE